MQHKKGHAYNSGDMLTVTKICVNNGDTVAKI
jgi:hypothetical protein